MMANFSLNLTAFCKKAKLAPRTVIKKVVLDVGTSIIERTPVGDPDTWADPDSAPPGYVGGRARGSWEYRKGTPAGVDGGKVDGAPAGHGQVAFDRIVAGLASGDAADAHYITSVVPYMRRLEYDGWSAQAPAGMVRVTVAEYQDYIDRAVASLP